MSLITTHRDHHKEYYYKHATNGAKLFYKRTAEGHKRIAKKDIPEDLVELISEYNKSTDTDWRSSILKTKKELSRLENILTSPMHPNITQERIACIINFTSQRIESCKKAIKIWEKCHSDDAEKRYKDETDKYGGFENYFKEKYNFFSEKDSSNKKSHSTSSYQTHNFTDLVVQGIITDKNTPKEEAKYKYRRWLVHNHPDKGGDTELCQKIISQYEDFYNQ